MHLHRSHQTISLTITLTTVEFDKMVNQGMHALNEMGEIGLIQRFMPPPDTLDAACDVAVLGVQEMIASIVYRSRLSHADDFHDDDVPF